ncbi:VOC family protein [Ideonella azotifigens]|uniref:VOC family protein n=1 Tax=Ideonella azotifigens TaxID=513160 RepID=A0ABN1JZX2_9BURK|nr:VOC family protein [Ideonella azotifigens]MCD2342580.1 VOC family protein [Ideonella azotifigens]
MIDHTGVSVSDYGRSKAFYEKALGAMGYQLLAEMPAELVGTRVAGFGEPPKPDFWIAEGTPNVPAIHIAFRVASRAIVDAFYREAMAAGGTDNGPPGVRAHYHPNYYGAFVRDPDGHNIEAVCHAPE